MLTPEEVREKYLEELRQYDYDVVVGLTELGQYEYIGTMSKTDLGEPPPEILTDEWLTGKGWLYSEEHKCWFYAGVGDIN